MALALYRKYRPATFAEVVGQEHVTVPLRTALAAGRVNHAYLFSGPRGCGKTSSARILARSLNCEQGPTDEPCGVCNSCVQLAPNGPGSVDVTELDAASHGGVDDARELRDRAFYAPAGSRYRVFIVDEAHMVTTQGFNALLKIVEEPPEHLVFIFATTEPEKVLATIRSRTHHYPFRLIPPGAMRDLLERNCAAEGAVIEPAVFPLVIRAGGGSARDTQSVLDQLLAGAGPEGVTYERAVSLLGVTDSALIDDMVDGLAANDAAAVYATVDRLVEAGHDPRRFASDLLDRLRDLVLLRAVPEAGARGLVNAPADELDSMTRQAAQLGPGTLSRYAEIVHTGLVEMRGATAPRLLLELLCARMLLPGAVPTDAAADSAVIQRLEAMERRIANAPAAQPTTPAPRAAAPEPARQEPARAAAPEAPRSEPARPEPARTAAPEAARPEPARAEAPRKNADGSQYVRPSQRAAAQPTPQPERTTPERPTPERPAPQRHAAPEPAPTGSAPTGSAQAPAAAPGGLDAAAVRRVWSELLATIRNTSKRTAALLATATVQAVEGDTLVIAHAAAPLARLLAETSNTDAIAQALVTLFGGTWKVRCIHADPSSAPDTGAAQPRTQPKATPERTFEPPRRSSRPVEQLPPEPPAEDVPPPPEPEDEEEMLAQAAHKPDPDAPRQDPEAAMLKLLAEKLGARPVEG
ncbi:DNA polymerase III subunits gamma and tau [Actinokineospora spheciospongiae]|uniref:DNA polymerase III subunit gamma/tau n=1 Tax=Actinokineospora spheciospongiae TaxID=909613 RepID=W7IZN3_9PSEU|nr:DNA polymerase III subunit gamma and tau [Actinokineospora spheciospongiae]EWC62122.1 DNA polymerase III subunits gamma and tau [Actinokineospora spheciospongiae]